MDLWNSTEWYVPVVYNVLLVVLPTLAALVVVSESGAQLVKSIRKFYQTVRPAIDEPTDPIIIAIAQKAGRRPEVVSAFLVENLDAVIALLPQETIK